MVKEEVNRKKVGLIVDKKIGKEKKVKKVENKKILDKNVKRKKK